MFNFLKFFGIYRLIKGFILKNAKESVRIHTFLAIFNVRILWIRDVFFCFFYKRANPNRFLGLFENLNIKLIPLLKNKNSLNN